MLRTELMHFIPEAFAREADMSLSLCGRVRRKVQEQHFLMQLHQISLKTIYQNYPMQDNIDFIILTKEKLYLEFHLNHKCLGLNHLIMELGK